MHAHVILFGLLWLGACGYALARGGAPERIMALCFVLGALLSPVVQYWEHGHAAPFGRLELGVFLIDTAIFCIAMGLALFSTRRWSFVMASMQATMPISHLANVISPDSVPRVYFAMAVFVALPQLLLLALATLRHRRRLGSIGVDFAWEKDLPTAYLQGATISDLRKTGAIGPDRGDGERSAPDRKRARRSAGGEGR